MLHRKTYVEKLTNNDFKVIPFKFGGIPRIAIEIFAFLTKYRIDD